LENGPIPDPPAFTGERVAPGQVDPELWNEHVARYRFAAVFATGKRVLDAGCGTGYGTAILAEASAVASGFDISPEAVEYARAAYPSIRFEIASTSEFPASAESVDLVTAFEVIEHLPGWQRLIEEAHRVLAPSGMLLLSTPNKADYAEARAGAGHNPFHVHEFDLAAFEEACAAVFPFVRVLAQNQQQAVVFSAGRANDSGLAFISEPASPGESQFFLAVCAKEPVDVPSFIYAASGGNILRERARWARSLDCELQAARSKLEALRRELEERTAWARQLESERDALRVQAEAAKAENQRLNDERALLRQSRWLRLGRALNLGPKLLDRLS
jgi:SAM-dependent methyltransferase